MSNIPKHQREAIENKGSVLIDGEFVTTMDRLDEIHGKSGKKSSAKSEPKAETPPTEPAKAPGQKPVEPAKEGGAPGQAPKKEGE